MASRRVGKSRNRYSPRPPTSKRSANFEDAACRPLFQFPTPPPRPAEITLALSPSPCHVTCPILKSQIVPPPIWGTIKSGCDFAILARQFEIHNLQLSIINSQVRLNATQC